MADPCIVSCLVRLVRAFLLDMSVWFFRVGSGLFTFGSGFFGLVRVWVKNHGLYLARDLLRVKNYDLCLLVALVGLDWLVFSNGLGWSDWVIHDQV